MKAFGACCVLCAALVACACTRPKPAANRSAVISSKSIPSAVNRETFTLVAVGEPYDLQIAEKFLTFCDTRGQRRVELTTGKDEPGRNPCSRQDPDPACSKQHDVSVRSPLSQPNDILDFGAQSLPMKGRVHDCAGDGKVVAVVTGASVNVIDLPNAVSNEISQEGGERVAVGDGWVVWTNGSNIHGARLR